MIRSPPGGQRTQAEGALENERNRKQDGGRGLEGQAEKGLHARLRRASSKRLSGGEKGGCSNAGSERREQDAKGEDSVQLSPGAAGFTTGISFWKRGVSGGRGDIPRHAWAWSPGDRTAAQKQWAQPARSAGPVAGTVGRELGSDPQGMERGGRPQRNCKGEKEGPQAMRGGGEVGRDCPEGRPPERGGSREAHQMRWPGGLI